MQQRHRGDPDGLGDDIRKVESNARHLLSLINDVLDLSKIESGKMEVFAETFDVAEMAGTVATTVQALIEKKGNTLTLNLAPDLGAMHSDATKVRQILLNLLSNAAKFTEGGSITLSAERQPGPGGPGLVTKDWLGRGSKRAVYGLLRKWPEPRQPRGSTFRV